MCFFLVRTTLTWYFHGTKIKTALRFIFHKIKIWKSKFAYTPLRVVGGCANFIISCMSSLVITSCNLQYPHFQNLKDNFMIIIKISDWDSRKSLKNRNKYLNIVVFKI